MRKVTATFTFFVSEDDTESDINEVIMNAYVQIEDADPAISVRSLKETVTIEEVKPLIVKGYND
jgi:hypothetical protein